METVSCNGCNSNACVTQCSMGVTLQHGAVGPCPTRCQLPVGRPGSIGAPTVALPLAAALCDSHTCLKWLQRAVFPVPAQVEHRPIPGVSSAMMAWWFNGNIDGDMLWNGVRVPRYLLWHPRCAVLQRDVAAIFAGMVWVRV